MLHGVHYKVLIVIFIFSPQFLWVVVVAEEEGVAGGVVVEEEDGEGDGN